MSNAAKKIESMVVREIAGWPLAFATSDDEPRILDITLAERLGYRRPRKIRDLIERLMKEGKIGDVFSRPSVGRGLFRGKTQTSTTVTEYLLTEAQALKVSAKSETDPADALLDEMIQVFMLARRGMLASRASANDGLATVAAALSAELRVIKEQIASLALDSGTIAGVQADWITGEIDALAFLRVGLGYNATTRAAKGWIQKRVDAAAEWAGTGANRRNMPAGRYPRVKVCLAQLRSDLEAEAKRRAPTGRRSIALVRKALQGDLFKKVN